MDPAAQIDYHLRLFAWNLENLTWNNTQVQIETLTTIAKNTDVRYAANIIYTIETHSKKLTSDLALLGILVIDSILKNVGGEYISVINQRIVWTFTQIGQKLNQQNRHKLFNIRQSWMAFLPAETIYQIDCQMHQIDQLWPMNPTPFQHNQFNNPHNFHRPDETMSNNANSNTRSFQNRSTNRQPNNETRFNQQHDRRQPRLTNSIDQSRNPVMNRQASSDRSNGYRSEDQNNRQFRSSRSYQSGENNRRFDPLRSRNSHDFKRGNNQRGNFRPHRHDQNWGPFDQSRHQQSGQFRNQSRFNDRRRNWDNRRDYSSGHQRNSDGFYSNNPQSQMRSPLRNDENNHGSPATAAIDTQELFQKLLAAKIVPSPESLVEKEYSILSSEDKDKEDDNKIPNEEIGLNPVEVLETTVVDEDKVQEDSQAVEQIEQDGAKQEIILSEIVSSSPKSSVHEENDQK